jgi:exonuclease SbcC
MKILAIRLKNLASIEALQVDFTAEPLRSAGIFAISGPTGSGKSTVLDALCLALYDKTPRFVSTAESISVTDVAGGSINQMDVKNILRRGAAEGYAEADFRGMDGKVYRSRWSVRRARNRANGSLQPQTMQVSNLTDGTELQGTRKELLAQLTVAIGLTYEQFTRTVLLAQNDFSTFLKSKEADKAELLEKLTGTEVYSRISSEVYRRCKEAREELASLTILMGQVDILPKEQVEELTHSVEQTSAAHKAEQERWRGLNRQLTVVHQYKSRTEALSRKQKEMEQWRVSVARAAEEHEACTKALSSLKAHMETFRPELLKAREQDVRLQALTAQHAQAEAQHKRNVAQLADGERKAKSLGSEREACRQQLEKLSGGRRADELLAELNGMLERAQQERGEKSRAMEAINIRQVSDSKSQLTRRRDALRQALTALAELAELTARALSLQQERAATDAELNAQSILLAEVKGLYEEAQLAVSSNVKSMRGELKEGVPCPVCGSTSHPYAADGNVVESLFNGIKKRYDDASERCNALRIKLTNINKELEFNARQTAERNKTMEPYPPEHRTADHLKSQIDAADESLRLAEEKSVLYQRLYKELQESDNRIASVRRQTDSLKSAMQAYSLAEQKCTSFAEQLQLLQKSVADGEAQLEQSSRELSSLKAERSKLLKGMSADEAERTVTRREQELTAALDKSRDAVGSGRATLLGIAGEARQMEEEIAALKAEYDKIESPDGLDAVIAQCVARGNELSASVVAMTAKLTQQRANEQKMAALTAQVAEKQTVAEGWSKLNDCIGSADGKAFKVIAQSYTLKLLLLYANKHLATLSRRYKLLQVPDTLALQVIDRDMCDEVRTVYSLSGGESFLISLALALGLSSLSGNGLKVESLFIDEGFGSLDADSLRIAMEALEMLQNQGRKIGVISHVQEMSERIAVQIRLVKGSNGNSEAVALS